MSKNWTREQLLVAFKLYCQMPFGRMHYRNPEIIKYSQILNRTPSALAMKLVNIASLDPAITSTGRKGLEGASNADKAMWAEMQESWGDFALEIEKAVGSFEAGDILKNVSLADDSETTVRIGQSFFRNSVLSAYNFKCCVTGLSAPKLLIASHIIPWSVDAANRLNPRNGLCLSMLHDKAFDIGIMAIAPDMTIMISKKDNYSNDAFFSASLLSYDGKPMALPDKFAPTLDFLNYHRENIFKG